MRHSNTAVRGRISWQVARVETNHRGKFHKIGHGRRLVVVSARYPHPRRRVRINNPSARILDQAEAPGTMAEVLGSDPEPSSWSTPAFLSGGNRRAEQDLPPLRRKTRCSERSITTWRASTPMHNASEITPITNAPKSDGFIPPPFLCIISTLAERPAFKPPMCLLSKKMIETVRSKLRTYVVQCFPGAAELQKILIYSHCP